MNFHEKNLIYKTTLKIFPEFEIDIKEHHLIPVLHLKYQLSCFNHLKKIFETKLIKLTLSLYNINFSNKNSLLYLEEFLINEKQKFFKDISILINNFSTEINHNLE